MKTQTEIMEMLQFPEEVKKGLQSLDFSLSSEITEETIQNLTVPHRWYSEWEHLKTALSPDEHGFKMLFCMLWAASYSYEKYKQKGISQQIFIDTMKCFTRFVKEHKKSHGVYGFDRDFWTGRQLSLQLFRLGELEFETTVENQKNVVSIHIPSDAVFTEENCKNSLEMAAEFFRKYDPAYVNVPYVCHSWLLSPALKELLPESSNIIKFQNLFTITETDKTSMDFMMWIFKTIDSSIENLPENTSLQRNVKEYLKAGGQVGDGKGYIRR